MRVVIVGAGQVGTHFAKKSSQLSRDVIVIDTNARVLELIEDSIDVQTLKGDGTSRKVLEHAGLRDSDLLLALTSSDSTNMVVGALAKSLGVKQSIVRLDNPSFFLDEAGVERDLLGVTAVVCSSRLISSEIQRMILSVGCEFLQNFANNSLSIAIIKVGQKFKYLSRNIKKIDIDEKSQIVGAFRKEELVLPENLETIEMGDELIIISEKNHMGATLRKLSKRFDELKVCIVGGGDTGAEIANLVEKDCEKLVVIEKSRRRCVQLSEMFDEAEVIHGDGTNISLLEEENIQGMDAVVSVTKFDDTNLMSSLFAKDLGVENTFSLVHRSDYSRIYQKLGIAGTTNSQDLFWEFVRRLTSKKQNIHIEKIKGTKWVFVESYFPKNKLSKPIKIEDLSLPAGTIFLGALQDRKISLKKGVEICGDTYCLFLIQEDKENELNSILNDAWSSN